jgi:hypothetical protein
MQRFGLMSELITVALGVVLAIAALANASAQQEPPHCFYGTGATAGDTLAANDAMGDELGSTTVDANGSWYIDIDRDAADDVSFTVNGEHATADVSSQGSGQSSVVLTVVVMEVDSPDDSMMDEGDDSMLNEDDSMMDGEDVGYPDTGTGGIADNGGVSAGLIALLIALGVASIAGLGLRRVRNRA